MRRGVIGGVLILNGVDVYRSRRRSRDRVPCVRTQDLSIIGPGSPRS